MKRLRQKRSISSFIRRHGDYMFRLTSDAVDNRARLVDDIPVNLRAIPVQDAALGFEDNSFGWPSNDISALMRAQSDLERERILSRLTEIKTINKNAGRSDQDILADIMPRYLGSYAELQRWIDSRTFVPEYEEPTSTEVVPSDSSTSVVE